MRVSSLKELLRISLILAALGWFFYVVFQSRFQEGFIFLMAVITVLIIFILISGTRFKRIRIVALILAVIFALVAGRLSILAAEHIDGMRTAAVRAVMEGVAESLQKYRASSGSLPECSWKCMVAQMEEVGLWSKQILYRTDGRDVLEPMPHIPLRDRWGCRYIYTKLDDQRFELISSGPDRRFGTRDDIVVRSWERNPSPQTAVYETE